MIGHKYIDVWCRLLPTCSICPCQATTNRADRLARENRYVWCFMRREKSVKSSHDRSRLPQKVTTSRTVWKTSGWRTKGVLVDENSREESPWRALREYAPSRETTFLVLGTAERPQRCRRHQKGSAGDHSAHLCSFGFPMEKGPRTSNKVGWVIFVTPHLPAPHAQVCEIQDSHTPGDMARSHAPKVQS